MANVGFIGLGTMGRPMAENLLRAGHRVTFFCRRRDVADAFEQQGGQRADSPAEVADASDWVFSIVSDDDAVRDVALGPRGLSRTKSGEGKVLVEMSTISPDTIREVSAALAEKGFATLDAPVSGGPWGAKAGTLTIMVGGDAEVVERSRSLLDVLGEKIFHVGPLGAGQTAKLVNQLVAGGIMALVAEGFAMGKAAGLNLEQLFEVMCAASAQSGLLEARGRKFVLSNHYEPGFSTRLMRKDVALAVRLAETHAVPLPVGAEVLQQYLATERRGYAEEDFSAIAKWVAETSGVTIP